MFKRFKRSKGFVFGILASAAVIFAAVQFGFIKVDLTVTEKGQAAIEGFRDQGSALIETVTDEASSFFTSETEIND